MKATYEYENEKDIPKGLVTIAPHTDREITIQLVPHTGADMVKDARIFTLAARLEAAEDKMQYFTDNLENVIPVMLQCLDLDDPQNKDNKVTFMDVFRVWEEAASWRIGVSEADSDATQDAIKNSKADQKGRVSAKNG